MWALFRNLDERWRERPLAVSVSNQMEHVLYPPIVAYLDAMDAGLTPDEEIQHLNRIAAAYHSWQEIQAILIYGRPADR
jgi:hypothetical protein